MGAPADPLILSQRSRIVRFAVEHRIPAMYKFREFVSDGGPLSYGPNLMEMFRRSTTDADRILTGAKPSDIPIERPTKFEVSVSSQSRPRTFTGEVTQVTHGSAHSLSVLRMRLRSQPRRPSPRAYRAASSI